MKLRGSSRDWPFTVEFIGALIVENVEASWFGGANDPEDSGHTASGFPTKGHPDLLACSLPMDFGDRVFSTKGSPIPRLPWGLLPDGTANPNGTYVYVWPYREPEKTIALPLIDIGPAKSATRNPLNPHAIDLTQAAFQRLGGKLLDGLIRVSYRVIGKPDQPTSPPHDEPGVQQQQLNQINLKLDKIMASQEEEAAALVGIKTEFGQLLDEINAKIAALTAAVASAGGTSPAVDAATADLKSSVEAALAQFAPPPPAA